MGLMIDGAPIRRARIPGFLARALLCTLLCALAGAGARQPVRATPAQDLSARSGGRGPALDGYLPRGARVMNAVLIASAARRPYRRGPLLDA